MPPKKKIRKSIRRLTDSLPYLSEFDVSNLKNEKAPEHKVLWELDGDGFEKHMDELFHWHVSQKVISILVAQLNVITTEFIDEVIKRLKSCNNTAFAVNEDLLSKEKNKHFVEIRWKQRIK